ncbi:imelysin family protein [Pseudoalteromonas luteoviolacea]|uniref:imelysin family protein n=1 Tax=Pseudoalteromonas luteoviolacea TaxID=43657 RepID=UPI001B3892E8|nr:imelysin family protein [Pseudoalteromonas luteoviolacea]MBQ4836106.1 imelysin family protein [Pseudoalteromonas luteoviolacea]
MRVLTPLSAVAVAVTLLLSGCGESSSSTAGSEFAGGNGTTNPTTPTTPTTPTSFDEAALVANLVNNVLTPTLTQFDQFARAQQTQIAEYCAAEKSQSDTAAELHDKAKDSWRAAMVGWQYVELMQVGPLLENGEALKNNIYSWPAGGALCSIDQDIVYHEDGFINGDSSKPYDIKARTSDRKGLIAIEHALFSTNYDHSCSFANEALAPWNSRTVEERKVARCEFAHTAAGDIVVNSAAILARWQGDNGFANQLINAGSSGSQIDSAHTALNEISKALFYMTKELKDIKLGEPLGLFTNSCGSNICPQDVESDISEHSKENLLANIRAFKQIFTGEGSSTDNTLGFDDFLDAEQGSDVKQRMLTGLAEAEAALLAIDGSLKQAVENETAAVTAVHDKVKNVTDELKNDFINKLALELPQTSAGDND